MKIRSARLAAALLAGSLAVTGQLVRLAQADDLPPLPATGCSTFTDPTGDGNAEYNFGQPGNVPSDPDVDLTDVTLASPPGKLTVYFHVVKLGAPAYGVGDTFDLTFTFAGKPVVIFGGHDDPAAVENLHTVPLMQPLAAVTYNATRVETPQVAYDPVHNLVVLTADRAPLEQAAKASLADGSSITNVAAYSAYDTAFGTQITDNAAPAGAAAATYVLGDNHCFVAAPAPSASPTVSPSPVGSPALTPTPSAGPALFDQPRSGCAAFTDPAGDAKPNAVSNDPDLDVTSVNFKTANDALSTFIHVVTLGAGPAAPFDGHRFAVSFTVGGKAIALTADKAGSVAATVGGTASTDLEPTAVFDTKNSNVVLLVPLAGLAKVTGAAAAGAAVTGASVTTVALVAEANKDFSADTATGTKPEEKTYSIGDNRCFLPPPGTLTLTAASSGQFSDATNVAAQLTSADGKPVPNATITVGLGGATVRSGTTGADGIAHVVIPITMQAGSATLSAVFVGTEVVGPTAASIPFTVLIEKTVLKAVGVKGAVTATLLDDDKTPVVGVSVVFTVGKKRTAVKTNAKGVARLGSLAKDTTVTVSFAGTNGHYAAAHQTSVKAL